MRIPLPKRGGGVHGYVLVDPIDADLAALRWHYAGQYARRGFLKAERKPGMPTGYSMHRVIAARMGIDDAPQIDHINRDKLDNRRSNLRPATAKLNAENRIYSNGTSRPVGRYPTLPIPEPRACRHCGTSFIPRRKSPGRIYCSVDCQRRAVLTATPEQQRERASRRWSQAA